MERSKQAYISYSQRADDSFIKDLLSAAGEATQLRSLVVAEPGRAGIQPLQEDRPNDVDLDEWILVYDQNGLGPFDSIRPFMEERSEGENIIVLLSEPYFQSPYCMVELLSIYAKRAGDLIPIIVFVGGYRPGDISIPKLTEYWDRRRAEAEKKGNFAAVRCYEELVQRLPDALAWLLGGYDEAREGWDTLFLAVPGEEDHPAQKVLDVLSRPNEQRYKHISADEKAVLISEEIRQILGRKGLGDGFKSLKARFLAGDATDEKFAERLARPSNAAELTEQPA
jgi:hypothetical protein